MKILITGTPGVGKSSVAKIVAKKFNCVLINEKQFALERGIGKWDSDENELVVPLGKLKKELNKELKKRRNLVVEGHMLCEIKLGVDYAVLIRIDPELLELRLGKKRYLPEKIMDNVFCEGIDYCKKHLERNYPEEKIIEVYSGKTIKETSNTIIRKLEKRWENEKNN